MKNRKMSPRVSANVRREQDLARKNAIVAGSGEFLFKNNTSGDLTLTKPTKAGRGTSLNPIRKGENFIGDSYYLNMVKSGHLKLLEVKTPMMLEEKLITEQPPIITQEGKVEFVVKKEVLTEVPQKNTEQLLVEDPVGGIVID